MPELTRKQRIIRAFFKSFLLLSLGALGMAAYNHRQEFMGAQPVPPLRPDPKVQPRSDVEAPPSMSLGMKDASKTIAKTFVKPTYEEKVYPSKEIRDGLESLQTLSDGAFQYQDSGFSETPMDGFVLYMNNYRTNIYMPDKNGIRLVISVSKRIYLDGRSETEILSSARSVDNKRVSGAEAVLSNMGAWAVKLGMIPKDKLHKIEVKELQKELNVKQNQFKAIDRKRDTDKKIKAPVMKNKPVEGKIKAQYKAKRGVRTYTL